MHTVSVFDSLMWIGVLVYRRCSVASHVQYTYSAFQLESESIVFFVEHNDCTGCKASALFH